MTRPRASGSDDTVTTLEPRDEVLSEILGRERNAVTTMPAPQRSPQIEAASFWLAPAPAAGSVVRRAPAPADTVRPRRRGVLSGLVVMAVGVPFILQALAVPGASAYLFVTLGVAFAAAYLRAHRQYVYLVPAAVFASFGVALLLPTWFVLRPDVIAPSFVGLLALGLLTVSILAPERRWPLIPAALLGAVALVDLIGGISVIPTAAAPFFVPVVLLAVGAYLLVEPQG